MENEKLVAYRTGLLQGTAYNRLHKHLTIALIPFGLSIPEWKLLGQLLDHGNVRLSELADYLSYDPPMITKIAKQLEKRNLIKRTQDQNDERAKIIQITQDGAKLLETAEPSVKKALSVLLNGTSRQELLTYIKVLTTIIKNSQ